MAGSTFRSTGRARDCACTTFGRVASSLESAGRVSGAAEHQSSCLHIVHTGRMACHTQSSEPEAERAKWRGLLGF